MHTYLIKERKLNTKIIKASPDRVYPRGFFDGAAADSRGGDGAQILISSSHTTNSSLDVVNRPVLEQNS